MVFGEVGLVGESAGDDFDERHVVGDVDVDVCVVVGDVDEVLFAGETVMER